MDFYDAYKNLDDMNSVFKEITYDEFMSMFEKIETGIVLLGGAWCKNAQLVVPYANKIAKENKIDVIYNFDFQYVGNFGRPGDLRTGTSLDHRLEYFNIAEKTGIQSDITVGNTMMPRIPSPTFVGIKNGFCVGYFTVKYQKNENEDRETLTDEELADFTNKFLDLKEKIKLDGRLDALK